MAGYNRIHIEGTLANGAEVWSTSFACTDIDEVGISDPDVLTTWANDCLANFIPGTGWPGDMRSLLGSAATVNKVRIYWYPTVASAAAAAGESSGASVAGSGTTVLPLQSALVYTLVTARPGRSYRGRMYWPVLTQAIPADGKLPTTSITLAARALSFVQMLETLSQEAPLATMAPVVVSKAQNVVTEVTAVRVGNVVDTQRRRRDNLVETFASQAI
jgi:hypothetical protein